jgi:hypothetical protein
MIFFEIIIDPKANTEIQNAIDYYDEKVAGLGKKFLNQIQNSLATLEINPFFQKRYSEVRCLPVKGFPYMIHFTVDETTRIIKIRAVLHTSLNPDEYWILE